MSSVPALNKGANTEALYIQLMTRIREGIKDGSLRPGAQIPTELELANDYHVSRGTIRQALLTLVNEGCLSGHAGVEPLCVPCLRQQRPYGRMRSGLASSSAIPASRWIYAPCWA